MMFYMGVTLSTLCILATTRQFKLFFGYAHIAIRRSMRGAPMMTVTETSHIEYETCDSEEESPPD